MIELQNNHPELSPAWWDAHYEAGKADTLWTDRRLLEHFQKELPRNARVLMLACGSGHGARELAARRPDLIFTLSDYSDVSIRVVTEFGPPAEDIVQVDLNAMPWPWADKSFDAVICWKLLEYLNDPQAAVYECRRVATKFVAATFAVHEELRNDHMRWAFDSLDPWKLFDRCSLRVHHIKDARLLVAFANGEKRSL